MFRPKLFDTLKTYTRQQAYRDAMAGLIVGIVALPLAIAFAIASGVSPEKGLYTAIIAGFLISALGGSRVQIGGPTGAFIVVVLGIVQTYGVNGLILATAMAGILLIIMGLIKLGTVIKYIPHPLVIGFTSGIALIIFSSQVKDFLGLSMTAVPGPFIEKWVAYGRQLGHIQWQSAVLALGTVLIVQLWPRVTHKVPGSLIAILVTPLLAYGFHWPVDTIGSRFGEIASGFPAFSWPEWHADTLKTLLPPAFTIAMLAGIESLLSAVVADGMIGGNHRSNTELIAQGTANLASAFFGGIPATGAIARTATNIKNGGRTPLAGIVHAITLLLIVLLAGRWAAYIPMATLAGILVVVAYNMSEWESFVSVARGPRGDAAVLITSFLLTVLVDLTVAIEIGMVMAAFLFMNRMIRFSEVNIISHSDLQADADADPQAVANYRIPTGVEVFEITGPLFFGAVHKFKDAMKLIEKPPRVLILRMRQVPMIDASGIHALKELVYESEKRKTKIVLSGVTSQQVMDELQKSRLLFRIGKGNVKESFEKALSRSQELLKASPTATLSD